MDAYTEPRDGLFNTALVFSVLEHLEHMAMSWPLHKLPCEPCGFVASLQSVRWE